MNVQRNQAKKKAAAENGINGQASEEHKVIKVV